MAIKLQEYELQFTDIQDLWMKAKYLAAKMISKYFNFEIIPEEEILIQSILIQQGYAMVTATYSKIPLSFRLVIFQKKVKLEITSNDLIFEEDLDGGNEDESSNI